MKTANLHKRTGKALTIILFLYAFLTATHQGEFWPFSIYQMFSTAGKPWVKVVTRQVSVPPDSIASKVILNPNQLYGKPLALINVGTDRNDLANYITHTHQWNNASIRGLRSLYNGAIQNGPFLIYKVTGAFDAASDSVIVKYTPFLYLTSDTTRFFNYGSMALSNK